MGTREFNNWYQEWSTHATYASADNATKMYAFRCMLPQALHGKILGVSPQPTTLEELVTKAREFDRLYCLYNRSSATNKGSPKGQFRTWAANAQKEGSLTQINYANLEAAGSKISKEEKECRYKEGWCFYCVLGKHLSKDCLQKKQSNPRNRPPWHDAKTQAVTTEEPHDEKPLPPYESKQSAMISCISIPQNHFDPICSASAPVTEDF